MLSYISHKFSQDLRPQSHEPRAALFLNRFTRTLTIMYATNGLAGILGLSADELNGKSFYYCIQENCLPAAVRCLESAKANDSIAYLRFWFRDPRQDDGRDYDELMADAHSSGDEDDGGVNLSDRMDEDGNERDPNSIYASPRSYSSMDRGSSQPMNRDLINQNSRSSSGHSTDHDGHGNNAIFEREAHSQSSSSSLSVSDAGQRSSRRSNSPRESRIELEAVVSCTSDGLVVILRRARAVVPPATRHSAEPVEHPYANGFFASPWATNPILPDPQYPPNHPQPPWILSNRVPPNPTAVQSNVAAAHGPASQDFMNSIREVAVFAWALTGINGSLAQYGRGKSTGESQPPGGLPIWDPDANAGPESEPYIGYDDGMEWKDTNGYQNRDLRHANNGHGSGQMNAYGRGHVNGYGNGNGNENRNGNRNWMNENGNNRNGNGNGNRNHTINGHGDNGHHLGKSYDFPGIMIAADGADSGGGVGVAVADSGRAFSHRRDGAGVGSSGVGGGGGTQWMYESSPEAKPWDRFYSKRNPAL